MTRRAATLRDRGEGATSLVAATLVVVAVALWDTLAERFGLMSATAGPFDRVPEA